MCASDAFLAKILTTHAHRPGQVQTKVFLELGRTWLPASELAGANEGDVVVFDGVAALPLLDPWPANIHRGDVVIPVSLRADGVVAAAVSGGDARDRRRTTTFEQGPVRSSSGLAPMKAEACAEIAAEIGRLGSAMLASLLCGVPLDEGRGDAILLRRSGATWAEGEILAVDGELAVRITRKLAA